MWVHQRQRPELRDCLPGRCLTVLGRPRSCWGWTRQGAAEAPLWLELGNSPLSSHPHFPPLGRGAGSGCSHTLGRSVAQSFLSLHQRQKSQETLRPTKHHVPPGWFFVRQTDSRAEVGHSSCSLYLLRGEKTGPAKVGVGVQRLAGVHSCPAVLPRSAGGRKSRQGQAGRWGVVAAGCRLSPQEQLHKYRQGQVEAGPQTFLGSIQTWPLLPGSPCPRTTCSSSIFPADSGFCAFPLSTGSSSEPHRIQSGLGLREHGFTASLTRVSLHARTRRFT